MKISNFASSNGNDVPNQFLIEFEEIDVFQSYSSIIGIKFWGKGIVLDVDKWDYSRTTGKYRNQFTRMDKKETEAAIKSGTVVLAPLQELDFTKVCADDFFPSFIGIIP